jgi:hypothetical protein
MNPHELKRKNDLNGLQAIHRFGWLRPTELGRLMWPGTSSNKKMAERLARGWIERKLVIARVLPDAAGRMLVLATAGARLLADAGIEASSGKDIGRFPDGGWLPPTSWKHDLKANSVLCELYRRGYTIIPEAELRRHEPSSGRKIPDGLAIKDKQAIWLEVEQARKTGPAMAKLANAIIQIACGNVSPRMDVKPTQVMIAYDIDARDERGYLLDHQTRVRQAVAKQAQQDIPIHWAACTRHGAVGVGAVEFSEEIIRADGVGRVLDQLNHSGWRKNARSELEASYDGYTVFVWTDEFGNRAFGVESLPRRIHREDYYQEAADEADAKYQAAVRVAEMMRG